MPDSIEDTIRSALARAGLGDAGHVGRTDHHLSDLLRQHRIKKPPIARGLERANGRLTFTSHHGDCSYKLFIPQVEAAPLRGLVMMLHGCTQTADDFERGTRMNEAAERERFAVVYPEQSRANNPNGCWRWFEPRHQQRGLGEPAMLAALARHVAADIRITAKQTFCAGLSAGGAMSALLVETYADVFSAAGVHSGLPAGAAIDVSSAYAAMSGAGPRGPVQSARPLIVFHGDNDRTVSVRNAERFLEPCVVEQRGMTHGRGWRKALCPNGSEVWIIEGGGHAWSGGDGGGTFADARGPSASDLMLCFFQRQMGTRRR